MIDSPIASCEPGAWRAWRGRRRRGCRIMCRSGEIAARGCSSATTTMVAFAGRLAECCARFGVAVWGYRLMPDHVHLILVPRDGAGLRAALGEAHRRYELGVHGYQETLS